MLSAVLSCTGPAELCRASELIPHLSGLREVLGVVLGAPPGDPSATGALPGAQQGAPLAHGGHANGHAQGAGGWGGGGASVGDAEALRRQKVIDKFRAKKQVGCGLNLEGAAL